MIEPKTKSQLATELGISLSTLQRWLKKHHIHLPRGLICPNKQREICTILGFDGSDTSQTLVIKKVKNK
jgi:DNA-directed RNA polymerase specialized sigma54-like protein